MTAPIGKVKAYTVIRVLHLKGEDAKRIQAELVETDSGNAPAYGIVVK